MTRSTYRPRKGTIAEMILSVKASNPNLSPAEIQRVVSLRHPAGNVSMSHVHRILGHVPAKQSIKIVPSNGQKNFKKILERNLKNFLDEILN